MFDSVWTATDSCMSNSVLLYRMHFKSLRGSRCFGILVHYLNNKSMVMSLIVQIEVTSVSLLNIAILTVSYSLFFSIKENSAALIQSLCIVIYQHIMASLIKLLDLWL